MTSFDPGEVFAYNYLWKRESTSGEETGRKVRPSCVMFRSARLPSNEIFLFPITTRRPEAERLAVEIPASERRYGGLGQPCWLIIDEYNITLETRTYDFDSLQPLGRFSTGFTRTLAIEIRDAIRAGLVSPVRRS